MPSPRLTAAAVAIVAVLAGCTPGADEQTDEPTSAGPAATPGAPETPAPEEPTTPTEGPTAAEPTPPETTPGDDEPADEPAEVSIEVTTVAAGLEAPWEVVLADDAVYLTERDRGAVLELLDDGTTREVATLPVDATQEGGLLGLAVDPDATELTFYAYYTSEEDNRVVRFASGGEVEPILTGIPKASNHNGGRVAFGPDGMLYVSTGDAGQAARSQDPESLAGKILRLTPDGDVPDDNPTPGSPVYALGLRNTQGLAWTPDGSLYAAEFGPDADDEINRIEPGGNYGWPEVTGEAGVDGFVDPVFVRQPSEASWSGLAVLTDGAIPQWEGDLFVAALRGQRLWRLSLADDGTVAEAEELLAGEFGRLRQVVQAPDGSLWVLTNNRDGRGSPAPDDDRILRLGPPD